MYNLSGLVDLEEVWVLPTDTEPNRREKPGTDTSTPYIHPCQTKEHLDNGTPTRF